MTCHHCLVTAHQSCSKSFRECLGLGMINIEAKYEENTILPLKLYDPFLDFLFEDNFALPFYMEEISKEREDTLEIMVSCLKL